MLGKLPLGPLKLELVDVVITLGNFSAYSPVFLVDSPELPGRYKGGLILVAVSADFA